MDPLLSPGGLATFGGLAPWQAACVHVAFAFGFYVRGAFGFGSNMPIVLLTTWLLGPLHTIVLVSLTAAIAQVHLLPQGFARADWRVAVPLAPGLVVGTAVGSWVLTRLEADALSAAMGVLIVSIVVMDRTRALERLALRVELRSPWLAGPLATVSAAFGTVAGGGGFYLLVGYLKLACPDPARLRSTNLVLAGVFTGFRVAALAAASLVDAARLLEAVVLVPAIFAGTVLGTRFFRRSSPRRFYDTLQLLMLAAALALAARGIVGLVP